jgi:tRNA (guanine-N7-)-methyltransferase
VTKRKLSRFAENKTFVHLFEPTFPELMEGFTLKGKWKSVFFKNNNPIVVELGCGKGEFTVGLAVKYPDKNFIGLDMKGARMWRGAKTTQEYSMTNVAFVRCHIELIESLFDKNEISEIWITFPDPQPQTGRIKKRLTSPRFLNRFRNIAEKGCIIHLKTDNTGFYEFTRQVIKDQNLELLFETDDVDKKPTPEDAVTIRTFYEEMFRSKGETIKYLEFILK